MNKEDIIVLVAVISGVFAILSAAINGIFMILNQWLTSRREERRHLLDLCFKAAAEDLQRATEAAKLKAQSTGQRVGVGPFELHLLHMVSIAKLSTQSHLSQERLLAEWIKIKERTRQLYEAMEKETDAKNQRN